MCLLSYLQSCALLEIKMRTILIFRVLRFALLRKRGNKNPLSNSLTKDYSFNLIARTFWHYRKFGNLFKKQNRQPNLNLYGVAHNLSNIELLIYI